jgi:epoxyqueuosine reductase
MPSSPDIKSHALALGFDRCGIAPVGPFPELAFLDQWLRRGYAGTMSYLGRSAKRRRDLRVAEPEARSVIVTATVYNTDRPHAMDAHDPTRGVISRYAWGDDYHVIVRQRLDALAEWLQQVSPRPVYARSYVDTGPVQERVFAQYAGIGWIGKNSCLIDPELGSWLFLGCLITDLELEPDSPGLDQCGDCTACLTACPTGAIVAPATIDATRCISYLTIELKKAPPPDLRPAMRSLVYGCDICQDVCPWNRRAAVTDAPEWLPREGIEGRDLVSWWRLSDDEIAALIESTPMTRAGVVLLRRNLAIAIGNAVGRIVPAIFDEPGHEPRDSVSHPVVAECVAWARGRLSGGTNDGTAGTVAPSHRGAGLGL